MLGRGKSYIGKCEFKRQRLPFGREKRYGFRLRFNTRADIPEREMEDTVIHEMIHLYILSRGIRDTSAHGKVFRSMIADINAKYGRHITVSHRMSKDERENMQGMKPSWRLIAIVSMTDGRTGIVATHTQRTVTLCVGGCSLKNGHVARDIIANHRGHILEVGREEIALAALDDLAGVG